MSQRFWISISSILGFLGVALGAFGAHILMDQLSTEMLKIFETGIKYQLIHTVVMLIIGFSGEKKYYKSEWFFLAGIILFSFSIYIYSVTLVKLFAMITPAGGVLLLLGWITLFVNALRKS